MDDQQNSARTQGPRRRAVRAVPMSRDTAAPTPTKEPVPQTAQPKEPMPQKPKEERPIFTEPPEPPVEDTPVPKTETKAEPKQVQRTTETFDLSEAPSAPRKTAVLPWIVLTLLVIGVCFAAMRRLMPTTAVVLYIGDEAVGCIEDEDILTRQKHRVDTYLADSAVLPADMVTDCRTEQTTVRGTPDYLSEETVYDALLAHTTKGYVRGYRLTPYTYDTAAEIGVLTEAELLSALEAACAIVEDNLASALPQNAVVSAVHGFTLTQAWIPEASVHDEGELMDALIASVGSNTPLLLCSAIVTETVSEQIPYETQLVPNDDGFDGVRTMISAGANGLAEVTYTTALDPLTGEVLTREETARVVKKDPVSAVAYEGVYPLPDGVSTGEFSWPLPELPDDDLPLDENGIPYTPENPLALKNTYVSSGYGERDLWGAYDFHLGYDIVAPAYTEIYAADGGIVVYAAYTSSYGYMTRIRHANNVETVYAHQIKQTVKAGDVVEKGQLIGYVGSTGTSSGNHLHLEFRRDHVTVDPAEYIEIPEDILVLGQ